MPKSAAFIQIKAGILEITSKIPEGRVTTYQAIAQHTNVMSRQVAYILAMLTDAERQDLPWYRVVADKGAILSSGKLPSRHIAQIDRLQKEGITFTAKNKVENFEGVFCLPEQIVSWNRSERHYLHD